MMDARNVETRGSRGEAKPGRGWAWAMMALLVCTITGIVVALLV